MTTRPKILQTAMFHTCFVFHLAWLHLNDRLMGLTTNISFVFNGLHFLKHVVLEKALLHKEA